MYDYLITPIKARRVSTILALLPITPISILLDMDGEGTPVTHYLVKRNLPTCVDKMRELYPNTLTQPNLLGRTPFNIAVYGNVVDMVHYFINNKIDDFEHDVFRKAFFDQVTEECSEEDAKETDKNGRPALFYAFCAGNRKSARNLLCKMKKEDIHRDILLAAVISNGHLDMLNELVPYINIDELARFVREEDYVTSVDEENNRENILTRIELSYTDPNQVLQKLTTHYADIPSQCQVYEFYHLLLLDAVQFCHIRLLSTLFELKKGDTLDNRANTLFLTAKHCAKAFKQNHEHEQFSINSVAVIELLAKEYVACVKEEYTLRNNITTLFCVAEQFWAARIFSEKVSELLPKVLPVPSLISKAEENLKMEIFNEIVRQRTGYRLYIKALATCDDLKKAKWLEQQLSQCEKFFKALPEDIKVSYIPVFIAYMWDTIKKLTDNYASTEILKIAYARILPLIEEKFIIKCAGRRQLSNISDYFRAMKYGFILGEYSQSLNQIMFILNSSYGLHSTSHLYAGSVAQSQLTAMSVIFINNLGVQFPPMIQESLVEGWDGDLDSYVMGVFELIFCNQIKVSQEQLNTICQQLAGYHYPKVKFDTLNKESAKSFAYVSKVRTAESALTIFVRWFEFLENQIAPKIDRDIKLIQQLKVDQSNIDELKQLAAFYEIKKICFNIFEQIIRELTEAAKMARILIMVPEIGMVQTNQVIASLKMLTRKISTYEMSIIPPLSSELLAELEKVETTRQSKRSERKKNTRTKPESSKLEIKRPSSSTSEDEKESVSEKSLPTGYPELGTGQWITSTKPTHSKPIIVSQPKQVEEAKFKQEENKSALPTSPQITVAAKTAPIEVAMPKLTNFTDYFPKGTLDFIKNIPGVCFIVGGALRDTLQGKVPKDLDGITTASMEEVLQKRPDAVVINAKHKMLRLYLNGIPVDLKCNPLKPGQLIFDWLREDLLERDYISNTLAYNPVFGLIDMLGAVFLLFYAKRLHPPKTNEDNSILIDHPIRLLRGIRFAKKDNLGFSDYLVAGIKKHKQKIYHAMFNIELEKLEREYLSFLETFKDPNKVREILLEFDKEYGDFGLYNLLKKRGIIKEAEKKSAIEAPDMRLFPPLGHRKVEKKKPSSSAPKR